ALVRLNFQATVVPDPSYPRSLGAVQVRVNPATFDDDVKRQFLSEWLDHINVSAGRKAVFDQDSDARNLQRLGLLTIVKAGIYDMALPAAALENTLEGLTTDLSNANWNQRTSFPDSLGLMSSWELNPAPQTPIFVALCGKKSGEFVDTPSRK